MNILAFDTATDNCSCAVQVGAERLELARVARQQHAQLLLPMVEQLLAEAGIRQSQLDAIVFGRGPGSFTGLRIAASAAQGIAYALDLPVLGVSTLEALAYQHYRVNHQTLTVAAIDARMGEVYWGAYLCAENANCTLLGDERVDDPASVAAPDARDWSMTGSGLTVCQQLPEHALSANSDSSYGSSLPQATDMLTLAAPRLQAGDGVPADQALPVYIRNKVALTEAERAATAG